MGIFALRFILPLPTLAHSTVQSCFTLCDLTDYTHQAPLSMGFSRQEHWSGLPFPLTCVQLSHSQQKHIFNWFTLLFCYFMLPGKLFPMRKHYLISPMDYLTWEKQKLLFREKVELGDWQLAKRCKPGEHLNCWQQKPLHCTTHQHQLNLRPWQLEHSH